ncbi:MAG: DUF3488 domain-containing protein [Desulfomonile tiedjei]|nr:DUF3488 domain-containing protein [Desulfomonile tiedjei]
MDGINSTGNSLGERVRRFVTGASVHSPVSVGSRQFTTFKYFLTALVGLSVASACIENGLHPLILLTLPLIVAALSRPDYSKPYLWSERATTVAFIVYAILVCLVILMRVRSIPLPLLLVYWTYGTMVARVLSPLHDRNLAQLIFLTAGLVLINCILTNHMLFGAILPLYLGCLMCALLLFDFARSTKGGSLSREEPGDEQARGLCRHLGKITVGILAFTVAAFVVLPRPFLVVPGLRAAISSPEGLAELEQRVSYRDMVNMAGRDRIAFSVEVKRGTLPDSPYWRGRVLDRYDGKGWVAEGARKGMPKVVRSRSAASVEYDFTPYKLRSRNIYACGLPVRALGGNPPRRLYITNDAEVVVDSPFLFSTSYRVTSVNQPVPAYRRQIAPNLDTNGITPRTAELAREWTSGRATPEAQAQAIIDRFARRFRYTLDIPARPESADPLEYFLFESRAGHCEYFAGALCIMLRSLGIPARVVEGFSGSEPTDDPQQFVVRFANAHAWVEAVLGGDTWTTLDPTPPAGSEFAGRLWRQIVDFYDRWDNRWVRNVVYFDRSDQTLLWESVTGLVSGEVALPAWLGKNTEYLQWLVILAGFLSLTAALVAYRFRRGKTDLSSLYLKTMDDLVSKGALSKVHSWHEESLDEIGTRSPGARDSMTRFMDLYLRGRFGNDKGISREELSRARRELLESVKRDQASTSGT